MPLSGTNISCSGEIQLLLYHPIPSSTVGESHQASLTSSNCLLTVQFQCGYDDDPESLPHANASLKKRELSML